VERFLIQVVYCAISLSCELCVGDIEWEGDRDWMGLMLGYK